MSPTGVYKHKKLPPQVRFFRHVRRGRGCWEWTARINSRGYGTFRLRPEQIAHRAAWILFRGPIPQGLQVLHRCDNRKCVRPSHLFLGTNADNVLDKMLKGRHRKFVGEEHGMARFTENHVVVMRLLRERTTLSLRQIAVLFGTTKARVSEIVRRVTWRHVA